MKLLNVAPVKAGDKVCGVWTNHEWTEVTAVRSAYPGEIARHDWLLTLEDGCNLWWIGQCYWKVQKNETAQCSSGQAGAEV